MVTFTDGEVLSITDFEKYSSDIQHFDLSKTFGSVNDDLMLLM